MKLDLITRLRELEVVRFEPVRLRHGGTAPFYVDIKKAYGDPIALRMMSEELWRIMDKRATCIVAGGYGGLPLAAVLSASHYLPLTLVREQAKDHGTMAKLEGYLPTAQDNAVICDDVCSTGKSIESYKTAIGHTGASIIGSYVIVNRGEYPVTAVLNVKEL
jgi:orotate phosphoribosyltransferase